MPNGFEFDGAAPFNKIEFGLLHGWCRHETLLGTAELPDLPPEMEALRRVIAKKAYSHREQKKLGKLLKKMDNKLYKDILTTTIKVHKNVQRIVQDNIHITTSKHDGERMYFLDKHDKSACNFLVLCMEDKTQKLTNPVTSDILQFELL
uniref:Uncharacterized protein n=1 Tax=Panagrolaimus sp. JU765 TaxID=591449 RepID=A0AC34Q3E0_9BILA